MVVTHQIPTAKNGHAAAFETKGFPWISYVAMWAYWLSPTNNIQQSTAPHKRSRNSLAMFISNSLWANAASSAARLGINQGSLQDEYLPLMVILRMVHGSSGQRNIYLLGTICMHSVNNFCILLYGLPHCLIRIDLWWFFFQDKKIWST